MKQIAFKMKLKAGFEEEYQNRHNEIWPELAQTLTNAGVYDYSIYWDTETNILFAAQKLADKNCADDLPQKEVVRKWWEYMSDIMEVNPDNSPVVVELKEVFHQD